jgi:hypothetical protein
MAVTVTLKPFSGYKSCGFFALDNGRRVSGMAWRRHFGRKCFNVHDYDAETGTFGELIDSFPNEKLLLAWINDECNALASA